MSRSDWLAIVGLFFTFLFGIPSVPLLVKGNIALAATAGLLALSTLFLTAYFWWVSNLPPFTVMSNKTFVEIKDALGKQAVFRKTVTLRPNHPGLQHYIHRNLSADGDLTKWRVDPGVTLADIPKKKAGDYFVTIAFPHQLLRFCEVTTWIETDCQDSFTLDSESVTLQIDQPTRAATIEIVFPQERLPLNTTAVFRSAGKETALWPPTTENNRVSWQYIRKRRNLSSGEYAVIWRW